MFYFLWISILLSFASLRCDAAVVDLIVIKGERSACPQHYAKVALDGDLDGDLNQGVSCGYPFCTYEDYIWLCVRYGTISEQESGITNLSVVAKSYSLSDCGRLGSSWTRIKHQQGSDGNLNQGVGGKYIYLCYQREKGAAPIVDLKLVSGDCDSGMYRIATAGDSDGNLNQDKGGKYIYVCKKIGCIAEGVIGRWVPHGTIAGDVTETWNHGTSKRYEESKTEDWSQSVSMTVDVGWELFGFDGSAEVTGSIAHATSVSYSREWSVNNEYTYQITWPSAYIGRKSWQFEFIANDSCRHSEATLTKEFAVTEGHFRPPCCAPGYATDAPAYKTCYSAAAMVENGAQYGCSVNSTLALPEWLSHYKQSYSIPCHIV